MTLRDSSAAIVLSLLLTGCQSEGDAPTEPLRPAELLPARPGANVLVVSFDALRADALGIYGYPLDTSPNIDRFGQRAVLFERAYSSAPVTPTAFAAMFTSRLPLSSFRAWKVPVALPTMAESFAAEGYATAAFLNNIQLTSERGFDRGFQRFDTLSSGTDQLALQAVASWLVEGRPEKSFAWVHFISPHSPYTWREESKHLYDPEYKGPFEKTTPGRFVPETPSDAARARTLYDGEIHAIDRLFGQLLELLEREELLEKTVIVLTADHGEEFGERGRFQHWSLYEEAVHVPLLIRIPDSGVGGRIAQPASTLDLWPTLASITGTTAPAPSDGFDLAQPIVERPIVSIAMTDKQYRGLSLTRGDWRLVRECLPEKTVQLYDLGADPGEIEDLAQERSDRADAMLADLRRLLGSNVCRVLHQAIRDKEPAEGLADETIEGLRALGYLN